MLYFNDLSQLSVGKKQIPHIPWSLVLFLLAGALTLKHLSPCLL